MKAWQEMMKQMKTNPFLSLKDLRREAKNILASFNCLCLLEHETRHISACAIFRVNFTSCSCGLALRYMFLCYNVRLKSVICRLQGEVVAEILRLKPEVILLRTLQNIGAGIIWPG